MQHIDSDNCRTYSDAARLLYDAKLYLQSTAAKCHSREYVHAYYHALALLTLAQNQVVDQWAAEAQDAKAEKQRTS